MRTSETNLRGPSRRRARAEAGDSGVPDPSREETSFSLILSSRRFLFIPFPRSETRRGRPARRCFRAQSQQPTFAPSPERPAGGNNAPAVATFAPAEPLDHASVPNATRPLAPPPAAPRLLPRAHSTQDTLLKTRNALEFYFIS